MRKWSYLLLGLFFIFSPVKAESKTLYVSPEGMSLTEALEKCSDGDVIEMAEGCYQAPQENFPLTVKKSVAIYSQEEERAVIEAPEFLAAFRIEADQVTLRGLDVNMRRTGIYAIGNDLTVENCRISLADEKWRTSSCGMWCGGIYNMKVSDCEFTGCGISLAGPPLSESSSSVPVLTGLFEVGEEQAYFTSHTIENCQVNGRPLFYAVSQDKVEAPEDAGEILCCGCKEVVVENADVSDGSMGMILAYNDKVLVKDCRADRCGVFGIYVAKCKEGILYGCSAEQTNHGLDIRASKKISLIDCQTFNCDQGLFFSHVDDSIMTGCIASKTGQGYFMAGGSGNTVYDCTAIECENGFNFQKEGAVLMTCCTIRDCTVCGVRLDGTPTFFSGNCVEGNWVGVMAYGEASFEITDNCFKGSGSCGLYLNGIMRSRFIGNVFYDSAEDSVQAKGDMKESLWGENILDKPIKMDTGTDFFEVI